MALAQPQSFVETYQKWEGLSGSGTITNPTPEVVELAGNSYLGITGKGIDSSIAFWGNWNVPGGKLDLWDREWKIEKEILSIMPDFKRNILYDLSSTGKMDCTVY
jgi:hypothetical protein